MRKPRLFIAVLSVVAVALAPVATAFAAPADAAKAEAVTSAFQARAGAAQSDAAKSDCHQPTGAKTADRSHCPDCGSDGSCNAACLLKCAQAPVTLYAPVLERPIPGMQPSAALSAVPPPWSTKPTPPPPRA